MRSVLRSVSGHLLACLSGLIVSHVVLADTTTCVSTTGEFEAALVEASAAASSGFQWIQVVQGTYDFSGSQLMPGPASNTATLAIEGGYSSNCSTRLIGAENTVLSGISALGLTSGADLTINDLSIVTIAGPPAAGGGVGFSAPSGTVTLDRVVIRGAVPDGYDYAAINGQIVELTNLAISSSNHVNCALYTYTPAANGLVFLSHLSVAVEQGSGVCLDGFDSAQALVMVNSIVETHVGDYDVLVNTTAPVKLQHNIYGARRDIFGTQVTMDGDTLWGWDVFADASNGDLGPAMTSGLPAIGMGDPLADGIPDDILGQARHIHPDIGAYENDRIFEATFN